MFKKIAERMQQGDPNKKDLTSENMPKNKYELFFSMLGLHFGDIFKMNLLFTLFILPAALWTIFNVIVLHSTVTDPVKLEPYGSALGFIAEQSVNYFWVLVPLLALAGPPLAGMNYVVSRWARDEHAWLWEDFKDGMKENWKQAAFFMVALGLILAIGVWGTFVYNQLINKTVLLAQENNVVPNTTMLTTMRNFLVFFLLAFASLYIYTIPMMVRYDLTNRDIYKNSMILSFAKLPLTILFGLFDFIPLVLGLFIYIRFGNMLGLIGMLIYYGIFGMTFNCFLNNSLTNSVFHNLMDRRISGGYK